MAGTITKNAKVYGGQSYRWRVGIGTDARTGKRKWASGTVHTKKEAEAKIAEAIQKARMGEFIEISRQTVKDILWDWYDKEASQSARATTLDDYEVTLRVHLVPGLGHITAQRLRAEDIESFYAEKKKAGTGARVVQVCHRRLSQALDRAVRLGIVPRNEAKLLKPPSAPPKRGRIWTEEEARCFLLTAGKSAYGPVWPILLGTGMRRGEALGLRWQDVDLQAGRARIVQSLEPVRGKQDMFEPKTQAGIRTVGLAPALILALTLHRENQQTLSLLHPNRWTDSGLVFTSRVGTPVTLSALRRDYLRLVKLAGVPQIRIHDQRKTSVTAALKQGVPLKVAAEHTGHTDIALMLKVYTHVLAEQRGLVADAMQRAFFDPRPDPLAAPEETRNGAVLDEV